MGAHRRRLGEFIGGTLFGGARDDVHLIGSILLDGGGHLTQTVHHLGLNLTDHSKISEMNFADINRAEAVAPFLRLGRDFGSDSLTHEMPVLKHLGQRHIVETADGRVADIRPERTARIGILEKIRDRITHEHFIPDTNSHGCPLFGIHRSTAEILLIETQVDNMALAKEHHQRSLDPEFEDEQMQSRLVDDSKHFTKEHIDLGLTLRDNGVDAKQTDDGEDAREENKHPDEGHHGGDYKLHGRLGNGEIIHGYCPP